MGIVLQINNLIGKEEYALNKIKHRPKVTRSPVEDSWQIYCRITQ